MAQGGLKGTLTANAISQTNPSPINGSVVVAVGDLVYAVFGEQIGLTVGVGATNPADNLGNTYTWCNAGTDPGTPTARAGWSVVTTAGTLTQVTAAATGSTNNYANFAAVIEGPFKVNASQPATNPANTIDDITSPFTCPASGTLPQPNCEVMCFYAAASSATFSATAPNLLAGQATSVALVKVVVGYQAVAAVTTVSPAFTGTNPTGNSVLGTTAFALAAVLDWFSPLALPAQVAPGLPAAYTQFTTGATVPRVLVSSWLNPFSEPVRSKHAIPWQRDLAWEWDSTPVVVLPDLYLGPLSEPVRVKPAVAWHQDRSWDWGPDPQEAVIIDWLNLLSEPVRSKQSIAWQQDFTTDWQWSAPQVAVEYWFGALSEPVQFKRPVVWQQDFTTDWIWDAPAVAVEYWFGALSEPVQFKRPVVWQQDFTTDWIWEAPVVAAIEYWFSPLTEPVMTRALRPWQYYDMDWRWEAPPRIDWYQQLAEPVRSHSDISWRQDFTVDWKWEAPFSITDFRFGWLSEPVRVLPGLDPSLQQSFTTDWKWSAPPVALIDYSFAITETGDLAAFSFVVGDLIIGANVAVTEIAGASETSTTVTEDVVENQAHVSITEIKVDAGANVTVTEIEL